MITKKGALRYDPQLIKPPKGYRGADSMDFDNVKSSIATISDAAEGDAVQSSTATSSTAASSTATSAARIGDAAEPESDAAALQDHVTTSEAEGPLTLEHAFEIHSARPATTGRVLRPKGWHRAHRVE